MYSNMGNGVARGENYGEIIINPHTHTICFPVPLLNFSCQGTKLSRNSCQGRKLTTHSPLLLGQWNATISNVNVLVIPQNLKSVIYFLLFLHANSRNLHRMMSSFDQPDHNNALESGGAMQQKKCGPLRVCTKQRCRQTWTIHIKSAT